MKEKTKTKRKREVRAEYSSESFAERKVKGEVAAVDDNDAKLNYWFLLRSVYFSRAIVVNRNSPIPLRTSALDKIKINTKKQEKTTHSSVRLTVGQGGGQAGLDVVISEKERGAIKRQRKKKRRKGKEKRNLFFARASVRRSIWNVYFSISRTYTSTTKKGWLLDDTGRRIIIHAVCTVLIHTYRERRMSLLLYIYVHTCARCVYT